MEAPVAELFLDAKQHILSNKDYKNQHKVKALFNLLTSILEEVTQNEKIVFTTLFSRACYVANKFKISSELMYYLHTFRRGVEREEVKGHAEKYKKLGAFIVDSLLSEFSGVKKHSFTLDEETDAFFRRKESKVVKFIPVIEGVVDRVDTENYKIYFYDDEDPVSLKTALFDQRDKNELFNENLEQMERTFTLPMHINLIDVEVLEDGTVIPSALVINPDYLVDVTAIANCFKDYGAEAITRVIYKFNHVENSLPLMLGNIANLFLDEIISNPDIKFKELLPKVFRLDPLAISNFEDAAIRELIDGAKTHYLNLKKTLVTDFPKFSIHREQIFLEPSFYSRDYGLQGRLDLFHHDPTKQKFDIVELKSGSPFRANVYGLTASHYVQTLLYDLMIKSTFGMHHKPNNFILYSKINDQPLKYAPAAKSQQYEAMRIRNNLVVLDYKMGKSAEDSAAVFAYLKVANFPQLKGFELRDLIKFEAFYTGLSGYVKSYFTEYVSFISREQAMSKTGEHGINKANGLSALWLETWEEKEDRFSILRYLSIKENKSKEDTPTLVLQKSGYTNALANFREGDIAVLYPYHKETKAVLKNQIFKCTILRIEGDEIEIRLRSKQYNDLLFTSIDYWNIEADSLDSGFNALNRSLFEFCKSDKKDIDLWLGVRPPVKSKPGIHVPFPDLTAEQNNVLNRMTDARDYFLLWGPPGTGKTSVMLKSLTERLHTHTKENILLLAYTNRAVDEICEAIESIGDTYRNNYVRIGSSSSCSEKYKARLLNVLIEEASTRNEIRDLIQSKRIFVSTVSSVVSKLDLFKLKQFDIAIVDEASQILEPMLLGLLSRVNRTVLIGDHKQLPAVVTQDSDLSQIRDKSLNDLGITNMSMSLFERLFLRCKTKEWDHALGILTFQGRMHLDIMQFPNDYFYERKLNVLPGKSSLLSVRDMEWEDGNEKILSEQRFIYIPTGTDDAFNWKTNINEAKEVVVLIEQLEKLYRKNNIKLSQHSIGVITPYRAQIAMIRDSMQAKLPKFVDQITIDTVERYQGGARDVIIISLCTNRLSQLKSLVSLSEEGIDRKLNVAMTRARHQLIVLGNREILSSNPTYKKLISSAFTWDKKS